MQYINSFYGILKLATSRISQTPNIYNMVGISHIWDMISLIIVAMGTVAVVTMDWVLLGGILFVTGFHKVIKFSTANMEPFIFARPIEAQNTNLLNAGGPAGGNPGFPSGHVMTSAFFIHLVVLRKKMKNRQFGFYIQDYITETIPLFVAYARVAKGAHNIYQVVAGYILGIATAELVFMLENKFRQKKVTFKDEDSLTR